MKQDLRQGCVPALLLFNIFFAAVIYLAFTRFKADKDIMDTLVHLRKKRGRGGGGVGGSNCRRVSPRDAAMGYALRQRCRGRLETTRAVEEDDGGDHGRVRGVGLNVSEAKTEIMCLRAKGMPEPTATFSVRGSGPGVQPDERVCIPPEKREPKCRSVHRGRPARTQRMVQLPQIHPRTVRPTERSPRAQNPDAKSRGTRDNDVRLRDVEPARVPLRHAAPSLPQILDSLHRLAKVQSRRPPDFLSGHASQD